MTTTGEQSDERTGARRFGVSVPQLAMRDGKQGFDPATLRSVADLAERAGYESLWTHEITFGAQLDPLGTLAFLACCTSRPRLGVAVLLLPLRSPLQFAKDVATLDVLSEGRMIVGVGIGQEARRDLFAQHGIDFSRRLRRMLQEISVVKALWTEETVSAETDFWDVTDWRVDLKPVQVPGPPIYFAGRTEAAIERAGRIGDGWISGGTWPLDELPAQISTVRRGLADRDPSGFVIGRRLAVAVEDRADEARRRLEQACQDQYANAELADKIGVYGTAKECAERMHELQELGVELTIVNPIYNEEEQLRRITEEVVIPYFS